jgi:hypothetical protein
MVSSGLRNTLQNVYRGAVASCTPTAPTRPPNAMKDQLIAIAVIFGTLAAINVASAAFVQLVQATGAIA